MKLSETIGAEWYICYLKQSATATSALDLELSTDVTSAFDLEMSAAVTSALDLEQSAAVTSALCAEITVLNLTLDRKQD